MEGHELDLRMTPCKNPKYFVGKCLPDGIHAFEIEPHGPEGFHPRQ